MLATGSSAVLVHLFETSEPGCQDATLVAGAGEDVGGAETRALHGRPSLGILCSVLSRFHLAAL